jgi:phage portal protein BeeE
MAGTHYKKVHDLNTKYAMVLENVKDNPEQLKRLDSFFEDVGNNKLHYGNVAPARHKLSHRFTKSLYDRQRAKVVVAA